MTKIIISFILIGAAIATIFTYVKPTFDEAEKIKITVAQYDKAISKAKDIQDTKRNLLKQYNLFSVANRAKLKKLLPDHVDNVRLVLDIDGIASARGIQISSIKIEKDADKSTDVQTKDSIGFNTAMQSQFAYQSLILKFSAVATYADFKLFLHNLEHSLRIVDLVDLSISQASRSDNKSSTKDAAPELYKFDIGIRTYWLK